MQKRLLLTTKVSNQKALRIANKIKGLFFNQSSDFDAQGSYTGVNPTDELEKPVQDADDL